MDYKTNKREVIDILGYFLMFYSWRMLRLFTEKSMDSHYFLSLLVKRHLTFLTSIGGSASLLYMEVSTTYEFS